MVKRTIPGGGLYRKAPKERLQVATAMKRYYAMTQLHNDTVTHFFSSLNMLSSSSCFLKIGYSVVSLLFSSVFLIFVLSAVK